MATWSDTYQAGKPAGLEDVRDALATFSSLPQELGFTLRPEIPSWCGMNVIGRSHASIVTRVRA